MKVKKTFSAIALLTGLFLVSCNQGTQNDSAVKEEKTAPTDFKEETVTYSDDTTNLKGFVVFDNDKKGKRPAVLVVPEWWGLGDYARMRARELAKLGYVAMAVDMYGNGVEAQDPKQAGALAMPFYQNPALVKSRMMAAINKLKSYSQVDSSNMAAIGYCYGGFIVLNTAKMGADLKAVVSFHGNLTGIPVVKSQVKAAVLVCHGEADQFVSAQEVAAFKKSMDSAGVAYTFKSYPNATHAFTNPEATAKGKKFNMPIEYNAAADTSSWNDMKAFFAKNLVFAAN